MLFSFRLLTKKLFQRVKIIKILRKEQFRFFEPDGKKFVIKERPVYSLSKGQTYSKTCN